MRKIENEKGSLATFVKDLKVEVGKTVQVRLHGGRRVNGVLNSVNAKSLVIDGTTHPTERAQWAIIREGGDWITKSGHSRESATERIHIRCTKAEKAQLARDAKKAGKPLSAYVLDIAFQSSM